MLNSSHPTRAHGDQPIKKSTAKRQPVAQLHPKDLYRLADELSSEWCFQGEDVLRRHYIE